MPFLKNFEEDIFISYAHIDNQPLSEGQKGWVTEFHYGLEIKLSQLLEGKPGFWRDESKLRGNDSVDDIGPRLPRIAILITVLTPRFVHSDWCLKELREFYRGAEQTGGVRVGDKSRIFKVVKTPVPPESHPPELQSVLGYEFYQIDPVNGIPRELAPNTDPKTSTLYWIRLVDLAYDIRQTMERINGHIVDIRGQLNHIDVRGEAAGADPATTVYLAETTLDVSYQRDSIKRELQQRGHRVLPDRQLSLNAADYKAAVREDLRRSRLSIHVIGANYGIVPEGADASVVSLQNELAAERSHDPTFTRIIWMPPGLVATEERQQRFIERLHNDPDAQHGAELLQTTIEDLKSVIQDKLAAHPEPGAACSAAAAPCRVYLVHAQHDYDEVRQLYDYLFDQGYEVMMPLMEGDEAEVYANHKENLLLCDAILIYCGNAGEPWVYAKLHDLRKLPGYGRTKPLLAKAFYISGPPSPFKERFRTREAAVIRYDGGFTPEPLQPLLAQLEAAKGAQ